MRAEEKQIIYKYLNELTDIGGLPQGWNDHIRIFINAMPEERCEYYPCGENNNADFCPIRGKDSQIAKRKIWEYFNQDIEFLTTYDYLRKRILNWLDKEDK